MKKAKTFTGKKFNLKKIIIYLIIIALAVGGFVWFNSKKKTKTNLAVRETDVVTRGNIQVTITGSASVEPYERFEIIPKVNGDIVYCPFNVRDKVEKGDLLYGFDTSNTDLSVERQRLSLEQSRNNYNNALDEKDKLSIKAKNNGIISNLDIKVGDEIKSGAKIADISDKVNLEVILPFTSSQIGSIHVGDAASITSSKHMSSVSGTVSHISATSYAGQGGTVLYDVTISFSNPRAFSQGMSVGGAVGENISPGSGTIENSASASVYSETDGTVIQLKHSNGDYVTKGTVIAVLDSDTVNDRIIDSALSYKSAELSMRQTEKNLEDYNITSPISGTVITKNSKVGDTIDKTTAQTVMMVVADISRLKFNLSIDELDISKVSVGQAVSITCDALPDEKFMGTITNISVEGEAQNGVTTYSAEVVIDEPGNLKPSMNIDASVIVDSAENVLLIPTEDIKTAGKRTFVFVKDDGTVKKSESKKPQMPQSDGKAPSGSAPQKTPGDSASQKAPSGSAPQSGGKQFGAVPEAPEGYVAVEIETGITNENFTEVKSGLKEGQVIYRQNTVSTSGASGMMGMGMGGGMSGGMGGRPSGNMGGGMGGGYGGNRSGGMGGRPSGGMR